MNKNFQRTYPLIFLESLQLNPNKKKEHAKTTNEISDEAADKSQSVAQQTKGAQQVSSAAEQLSVLAGNLDEQVKKFKL